MEGTAAGVLTKGGKEFGHEGRGIEISLCQERKHLYIGNKTMTHENVPVDDVVLTSSMLSDSSSSADLPSNSTHTPFI